MPSGEIRTLYLQLVQQVFRTEPRIAHSGHCQASARCRNATAATDKLPHAAEAPQQPLACFRTLQQRHHRHAGHAEARRADDAINVANQPWQIFTTSDGVKQLYNVGVKTFISPSSYLSSLTPEKPLTSKKRKQVELAKVE